jgi:hypothetical protein
MTPSTVQAIADFLHRDGRVVKLPEAITVTDADVIAYLLRSGIAVRRTDNNWTTAYLYRGKRVSLTTLVKLANQTRRKEQLPPFAIKV